MDDRVLAEIESTAEGLCTYAEKGRVALNSFETDAEPIMSHEPKLELLKPLKIFSSVNKVFAAVDCSTIPLIRGNNFGAYIFRVSATMVKPLTGKEVNWSYEEHFQQVVGNEVHRKSRLQSIRFNYESKVGLPLLNKLDRDDYLILDGGSYFGGTRGFNVSLYEECRKRGIKLLTFSKTTQSTLTSKGTDFLATLLTKCMDNGVWLYHLASQLATPRPSSVDPDVFAELWTKIIMKTTFKRDRDYLTENTPYLEYSDVEVKVLDQGEALLVSEPQLRFAVPIKTIYYPEYLEKREKVDYGLKPSRTFSEMDEKLRKIQEAGVNLTPKEN